jgi:hypothetical protein
MSYLQTIADAVRAGILEDTWTAHASATGTEW